MTAPDERELLEAARRWLQQSERDIDELTLARLRAARLRALDARPRPRFGAWRWAGGMAAAGVVAALAGVLWFQTPADLPLPPDPATNTADADLPDMEFYDWLADEPDAS